MKHEIKIINDDITKLKVDAIVNAANVALCEGAGVNGAIHRAAGPALLEECQKIGRCQTGRAKLTKGYRLAAQFIIHAVGPIWRGGSKGEPQLLASCYESTLKLALDNGVKTIAFPAISCGLNGYPLNQAAMIAVNETANFLELHDSIETVYFTSTDESTREAYTNALNAIYHE